MGSLSWVPHEALYGMLGTVYAWSPTFLGGDEETTLREAEDCARRAFELNPDSAQGVSIMGQVAYRRGQAGEAVRLLTRACAADPNNPDAMHQLGGAYLLGGRTGPMREVLTRLAELDPLTASNHCLLGLSYMLGGDAPGRCPPTGGRSSWIRGAPSAGSAPGWRWWPPGARPRRRASSSGWNASLRTITWRRSRCASGAA